MPLGLEVKIERIPECFEKEEKKNQRARVFQREQRARRILKGGEQDQRGEK